ncbi:MAG: hypothetical protein ACR2QC_05480, partial [Gammaproteobacteria bacterium]
AVLFVFADNTESGGIRKHKKTAIPAKAGISLFTLIFRFNHPSHSCEGRNLYAEGGNCTISRRFAVAEIPAFAGMGRAGENGTAGGRSKNGIKGAGMICPPFCIPRRRRILLYFRICPAILSVGCFASALSAKATGRR